jgi:hypothetical protein
MIEQTVTPTAISPERLAANRANAQLSTGPSLAGIAVSSELLISRELEMTPTGRRA